MTALDRYELLEAEGRYFDGRTAQARSVVVKFGDASLIVMDMADTPVTHWPLVTLRRLQTAGDALALIPDHGSEERLMVEDKAMIAAIREVCPDLDRGPPTPRRRWGRVALWAVLALGSIYAILFELLPALSDQLAELIPPEAEIAMGEEMAEEFAGFFSAGDAKFCETPSGRAALDAMTARLEAAATLHVPLTVRVLEHKAVNAFALPGGQVVIFSGLIDAADGPEEVAGVLAHEIGHVAARDPTRLTLRAAGSAGLLGLLLGDFTGAGATVALVEALAQTGYRREAERAADAYATEMLSAAGLPTTPFAGFFGKLRSPDGRPRLLSHISTHPDLEERAEAARAADKVGDGPYLPALADQEWVALQGVCE